MWRTIVKRCGVFVPVSVVLSGSALTAELFECEIKANVAWMEQGEFENKVTDMGYTIEQLAVTEGNCYQLIGQNRDGQVVAALFNPQSGELVQESPMQ